MKQFAHAADVLRQRLVGTWRLVSYVERDVESSEESHPMGERPLGLLIYAQDGFMSVQLSSANRLPFQGSDPYCGTPEEYTGAASRYIAYSGPFYIDVPNGSLIHEMQVSLFPNWLGQRQVRRFQIEGDLLRLATDRPMNFGGALKTATLVWRRVQSNS